MTSAGSSATVLLLGRGLLALTACNGDIPATGRRVDFTIGGDCEIQDRQIVSMRMHFDRLEILEQLGVAPVSAPTA